MKRFFKIITACVLCVALSLCTLPAAADSPVHRIEVSSVTAVPQDTIVIKIDITENPGIMAMTFAVAYDNEALTFSKYKIGIFNDYTIVDHPDKGYVSFVNVESKNRKYTGTIFTLYFTVNDTAKPGHHPITIKNIYPERFGDDLTGCFADWDRNQVTPVITNGGVTVGETCLNVGHKFSDFKTTVEPLCSQEGVKTRSCNECGHTELGTVPATGHDFADDWTVDTPATATQSGIMTRHCKSCEATTDKVYFSLKDTEDNEIDNIPDSSVTTDDWDKLEEIEKDNEGEIDDPKTDNSNGADDDFKNAQDLIGDDKAELSTLSQILNKLQEIIESVSEFFGISKDKFLGFFIAFFVIATFLI